MEILDYVVSEEKIFDVIVCLEMVKAGYTDKKSVSFNDGWKLSVSRFIENEGFRDYLKTGLALRMANYKLGIKDTAIILYPQIEEWIKTGQEIIKYDDITIRTGSLILIKTMMGFQVSDGINVYEISERERKKIAYAMKYRWYYVADGFKITDKLTTYRGIPVKEPPKFYLLMEV